MIRSVYATFKDFYTKLYYRWSKLLTMIGFALNGVKCRSFITAGFPLLDIHPKGSCSFGAEFSMVNKARFATLGKSKRCKIVVGEGASLVIGDKVGMSSTTIVAATSVTMGSNILIGGGVTIVDTDFHSLNPAHWHTKTDLQFMRRSPVVIGDNVFIGMDSIILKGVTIGSNVIIRAGSVVSEDITDGQIWGGNPAQFIKNYNV